MIAVTATRSYATNNNDGIIGVLTSNGITMDYLDEIGGSGTDEIGDIEIYSDTLYWTGDVQTGFPVSTSGVYDNTFNGGISDAVIGKCYAGGDYRLQAIFWRQWYSWLNW
ncbi:MAG: hypothetical protein U0T81_04170 [Saprospiraceae bacterium]